MKIRIILLLFAIAGSLQASVSEFFFTGTVDTITQNLNPAFSGVSEGDNISGHFQFDADRPLSSATYDFSEMSITIGANTISLNHHIFIRGENNYDHYNYGVVDQFTCGFDSAGATTELAPLYVYGFSVRFIDTNATIFAGASDPDLPVALNLRLNYQQVSRKLQMD